MSFECYKSLLSTYTTPVYKWIHNYSYKQEISTHEAVAAADRTTYYTPKSCRHQTYNYDCAIFFQISQSANKKNYEQKRTK